ncbi:homocysteine S-methyltransferase family protein [Falsirhodobacter halotolerans]|uniref:homocysteine S-methyltransferase family protein n=1 Tax=Falsirhodobacter halotolerans TaxID=1146892 RepID=UPI001FD09763|nr:homocysteine S-methyltransferase family protein [Falsirhodobacter halotolerans]MCJ8139166.1 homocysteine S-methyltransferase family protein [Falsirhodobacter halotolerans]
MAITILDGGMGRELERSGAPFRQPEWSALALMEAPETVTAAHSRFIKAGAQVITTNSYALVPYHIGEDRFRDQAADLAALAGRLAREAADAAPGTRVAGSLPPVFGSYRPEHFRADTAQDYLSVLVTGLAPSVDLWLAETTSSLAEAQAAATAVADSDKPLWISFTLRDGGVLADLPEPLLRSGERVADAVRLAHSVGAQAILFNCAMPEVMGPAIAVTRQVLADLGADLQIGVYANAFASQDEDGDANDVVSDVRDDLDPHAYCGWTRDWAAAGATIIGGCCGIGAEHIHALTDQHRH